MEFLRKLPIPKELKEAYPLSDASVRVKAARDTEIRRILTGEDDRLLVVVGPCSADREDAVLEYSRRLGALAEQVRDKLFLVPRIYTNKPRTTGDGYTGMWTQPDPNGAPDLLSGIVAVRKLHLRVLSETGLSAADELLYPQDYRYLSDLLSYVAVGARSVENQEHRLVASGLDIPVGMKNPRDGDLETLVHSVYAARRPHTFLYRGWEVKSEGNPLAHAVLRGGRTPNYDRASIEHYLGAADACGIPNAVLLVDCNHANSGKQAAKQPDILRDVMASRRADASIARAVKGFMIESYLQGGHQPPTGGAFGCSITDECLGWQETEALLLALAEQI